MRVANVAHSNLSNIGTNLSRGLRAHGHEARSIVLEPDPFGMDIDLMWSRDPAACRGVLEGADLLHLNSLLVGFTLMLKRPPVGLARLARGKRVVLQYHGGDLRRAMHPSVKALIARYQLPVFVTVPDLVRHLPGAKWLPIPVDPEDPRYRPANPPASPIRVSHAPTTRGVKKTDAFLAAIARLRERYDVEAVLVEHRPYAECLAIKRTCHINFDNIGYGSYAMASIESLLMEQPSLVYLNDVSRDAVRAHSTQVGVECPLVPVGGSRQPSDEDLRAILEIRSQPTHTAEDVASVAGALEILIKDDSLRRELGRRGRRWATAVHDERRVGQLAFEVYERAAPFDGFRPADRVRQFVAWGLVTTRNLLRRRGR